MCQISLQLNKIISWAFSIINLLNKILNFIDKDKKKIIKEIKKKHKGKVKGKLKDKRAKLLGSARHSKTPENNKKIKERSETKYSIDSEIESDNYFFNDIRSPSPVENNKSKEKDKKHKKGKT